MSLHLIQHVTPFTLQSGGVSRFKIECDALTEEDCHAAANWLLPSIGQFGEVIAVPSTGPTARWFADGFRPHATSGPLLIVDDVLTTGGSMEEARKGRVAKGAVIFTRGTLPWWVTALFALNQHCWGH